MRSLQAGLVLWQRVPEGELEEPQAHLPQRRYTTNYPWGIHNAERLSTVRKEGLK